VKSIKTSVFYYTHNLISPSILKFTLESCISHCRENNCELIVTSHYPVTNGFQYANLRDCKSKSKKFDNCISKNIIVNIDDVNCKAYVLGKMEYSVKTIIKQLIFSLNKCNGDIIILMEHDCLYPKNYISTVSKLIENKELTYCQNNTCFITYYGFIKSMPHVYLSSFSFKKETLKKHLEHKLEMFEKYNYSIIEPILDIKELENHLVNPDKKDVVEKEISIGSYNNICMDDFLGEGNDILDFVHGLNSSSICTTMSYIGELNDPTLKHYKESFFKEHKNWGNSKQYIDLIDSQRIDEETLSNLHGGVLINSKE
jgi:hypothetical protein